MYILYIRHEIWWTGIIHPAATNQKSDQDYTCIYVSAAHIYITIVRSFICAQMGEYSGAKKHLPSVVRGRSPCSSFCQFIYSCRSESLPAFEMGPDYRHTPNILAKSSRNTIYWKTFAYITIFNMGIWRTWKSMENMEEQKAYLVQIRTPCAIHTIHTIHTSTHLAYFLGRRTMNYSAWRKFLRPPAFTGFAPINSGRFWWGRHGKSTYRVAGHHLVASNFLHLSASEFFSIRPIPFPTLQDPELTKPIPHCSQR